MTIFTTLGDSSAGRGLYIGLRLLLHRPARLLLSCSALSVAVVIMFVELGMFRAIVDSQANIPTLIEGDLVAISKHRVHLNKFNDFDHIRIHQIRALGEVRDVIPIYKEALGIRNPDTGRLKRIVVYAFPPESAPFRLGTAEVVQRLKITRSLLFDTKFRDIYGELALGDRLELGNQYFELRGYVELGPNLISDGNVIISESSMFSIWPRSEPSMAVIRLKPGVDLQRGFAAVHNSVGEYLTIMTPHELYTREVAYTTHVAPVGGIFAVGVVAGLIIGVMICYQVLFNEVTDHLAQYATLKAMGFSGGFLRSIVIEESVFLSLIGFCIGSIISYFLYQLIAGRAALLMHFHGSSVAAVAILSVLMCIAAGIIAGRKVQRSQPAELY